MPGVRSSTKRTPRGADTTELRGGGCFLMKLRGEEVVFKAVTYKDCVEMSQSSNLNRQVVLKEEGCLDVCEYLLFITQPNQAYL